MNIHLKDENETKKLGKLICENIYPGLILALIGDLGSGKTTISKSIIGTLTNSDDIPSPTFNLVNVYKWNKNNIYHYDFYRLEDENDLISTGFDDYLSDRKSLMIIEWADKFIEFLPRNYVKIEFKKNNDSRDVKIISNGNKTIDFVNNLNQKAKEIFSTDN